MRNLLAPAAELLLVKIFTIGEIVKGFPLNWARRTTS